jgi:hypothetical protein
MEKQFDTGAHFINMKILFFIYIKMTAINTVGAMEVIPGIICLMFCKGGSGVWPVSGTFLARRPQFV